MNDGCYLADTTTTTVYFGTRPVAEVDEPPRRHMADWIPERGKGLRDRGARLPARRSVRPARRCSAAV